MNPAAFSSLPTNAANATRQTQLNHSKPCVGANFHFWSVVGRKRHCDRVFFWSVCFLYCVLLKMILLFLNHLFLNIQSEIANKSETTQKIYSPLVFGTY